MVTQLFFGITLVWLAVLTIAFVGVTRHLGAAQVANGGVLSGYGGAVLDADGPWIPSALPDRVQELFDDLGVQTDDLIATFFSSRCGSCLERAEEMRPFIARAANNVFLVAGSDPELVQTMVDALEPTGVRVVVDPAAQNIVKGLDIKSTPFTFRVIDGQVVAKSVVRGAGDYTRMTDPDLRKRIELPVVPATVGAEAH